MGKVIEILFYEKLPYVSTMPKHLGDFGQSNNSDFIVLRVQDPPGTNPSIQMKNTDASLRIVRCEVYRLGDEDVRIEKVGDKSGYDVVEVSLDKSLDNGEKLEIVQSFNKVPSIPFDLEYKMPPDPNAVAKVIVT